LTFTFFTIEDYVKQLQAGLLTIESSYSLRLPIRLWQTVAYGLTLRATLAIFVIDYSGGSVPCYTGDSLLNPNPQLLEWDYL
jgi:hypothetical protein